MKHRGGEFVVIKRRRSTNLGKPQLLAELMFFQGLTAPSHRTSHSSSLANQERLKKKSPPKCKRSSWTHVFHDLLLCVSANAGVAEAVIAIERVHVRDSKVIKT